MKPRRALPTCRLSLLDKHAQAVLEADFQRHTDPVLKGGKPPSPAQWARRLISSRVRPLFSGPVLE